MKEILKSVYYDKLLQVYPLGLSDFEFDETITNFKYATSISNMLIYTDKGKEGLQDPDGNFIQIQAMPEMTEEKAEFFANDLLWRYEKNGLKLENKHIVKTRINNHTAFELETPVKMENKKGIMYQVVLVFETKAILLMGTASHDLDAYLAKYKETAKSIKLK